MRIGILTYYRVANFGANLQAASTYHYLKNQGHTPIMLNYVSEQFEEIINKGCNQNSQFKEHIEFVDKTIKNQVKSLHTSGDVRRAIKEHNIEAVIIGSDAVLQHHPLLERIKRGKRKPFYVEKVDPDRMYPSPYWGVGFNRLVPTALMSVSSQDSQFKYFSKDLKHRMLDTLLPMRYISVRDEWTKKMINAIGVNDEIPITPDPVFGFNYNMGELIESKEQICRRYGLPEHYVLVSLHSQCLSKSFLHNLNEQARILNKSCVSLPMPTGIMFESDFDYKISTPLSPLEWYGLIKYADAYIGSNMHPIVVALHNAVPCFAIDIWGTRNFWGIPSHNNSSKVKDILSQFGLRDNISPVINGLCNVSVEEIISALKLFPVQEVKEHSKRMYKKYNTMMENILFSVSR